MIELLGVGVQGTRGEWLLHRVSARIERGTLSAVVARSPRESGALLDAVTGRSIPHEGRVWVGGLPLMRETAARVRALVCEAELHGAFAAHRSVLGSTLGTRGTLLGRLLRFAPRAGREAALRALEAVGLARRAGDPVGALSAHERAQLALARALARRPAALVLRDVDMTFGPDETAALLDTVCRLARGGRLIAIVSLQSLALARAHADRVLVLAQGQLASDTPARELEDAGVVHGRGRVALGPQSWPTPGMV